MKITIVGGGNIGTQFAVHCSEKGHDVTIFTSNPELFSGIVSIVDENTSIIHTGKLRKATSDPKEAFMNSDLIFITYPATMMHQIAEKITEYADTKVIIGVVPGNGGSECAFRQCIERGNVFFGIERVPAIARLVEKGKVVKSAGYRDELHVAAMPKKYANKCAALVESIFDIKTTSIPNYLNLTMTPSNPILHTTRLWRLFRKWQKGSYYVSVPLFYEEWDDESSEMLLLCDAEEQRICCALPEFQLEFVKSLREHYESNNAKEMTRKIRSIPAFKGLETPTEKTKEGFIPDLHSRYFTADFSFGLSIIQQIAQLTQIETPIIDMIMKWYDSIKIEENAFCFFDYGITDKQTLKDFYML